jgi:hypothetical protein
LVLAGGLTPARSGNDTAAAVDVGQMIGRTWPTNRVSTPRGVGRPSCAPHRRFGPAPLRERICTSDDDDPAIARVTGSVVARASVNEGGFFGRIWNFFVR